MRRMFLALSIAAFVCRQPLMSQLGEEDIRRAALWQHIKRELAGSKGSQYFEQILRGSALPNLDGILVSSAPADHPTKFLLAMPGSDLPQVTLLLKGSLAKPLPPGSPVTFAGVARDFNADPFMLTFEVETVNRATVPARESSSKDSAKKSK